MQPKNQEAAESAMALPATCDTLAISHLAFIWEADLLSPNFPKNAFDKYIKINPIPATNIVAFAANVLKHLFESAGHSSL